MCYPNNIAEASIRRGFMIVKEKSTPAPTDKFGRAGHKAELQMAFYLRRAFADDKDVLVFNDLRLQRKGETAQIDHLVFHRYGFVIVESKSVTGQLVVNAQGEFTRIDNGKPSGIQSPIQQAKLQSQLLAKLLNDHKEQLRRKIFFGLKQAYFGDERFRVLVAISDSGVIARKGIDPPELLKADSVADAIRNIIKTHADASGFSGFVRAVTSNNAKSKQIAEDHLVPFTDDEMIAINRFLLDRHTPAKSTPAASATVLRNRAAHRGVETAAAVDVDPDADADAIALAALGTPNITRCKHCSGASLAILYGRYGYYFRCRDCRQTMPIDPTCTGCGKKARISKTGREFRRICGSCGQEVHFHTNAPAS